jgi:CubicO group peptidase (beta-lactamase class C family)
MPARGGNDECGCDEMNKRTRSSQMRKHVRLIPVLFVAGLVAVSARLPVDALSQAATARPPVVATDAAAAQIDALIAAAYKPDRPGAAAIVVKDGRTVLRKGYGLADLELRVPVEPDMIFRIGSVTKQFTATAILLLAERGKLAIEDPITKFLPDYPTRGETITIEHLLTHTSGIKSYTGMPAWRPLMMKDLSVAEMIEVFKNEPADFKPGTRWLYNNSGYFLLGAIIERISGQTYEQFIEKEIFAPIGMTHSFYGNNAEIIPRRVPGYEKRAGAYVNASYLSMTQPYAAGSLISSVDDLALWDAALSSGKVLTAASMRRMFTPYALANGASSGYAYGWGIENYDGHLVTSHGGGINGFVCSVVRFPDDHVYVAVLSNNASDDGNPGDLARRAAAIALGRPVTDPPATTLDVPALDALTGTYQAEGVPRRVVTREGNRLFMIGGGPRVELVPASATDFFVPNSLLRLTFTKDASGRATSVRVGAWGVKDTLTRISGS